jgi:hypothetical protein
MQLIRSGGMDETKRSALFCVSEWTTSKGSSSEVQTFLIKFRKRNHSTENDGCQLVQISFQNAFPQLCQIGFVVTL